MYQELPPHVIDRWTATESALTESNLVNGRVCKILDDALEVIERTQPVCLECGKYPRLRYAPLRPNPNTRLTACCGCKYVGATSLKDLLEAWAIPEKRLAIPENIAEGPKP